ncbi:hypothetical protein FRB94_013363, partial [Tulasnella sp. JGI-2019a]
IMASAFSYGKISDQNVGTTTRSEKMEGLANLRLSILGSRGDPTDMALEERREPQLKTGRSWKQRMARRCGMWDADRWNQGKVALWCWLIRRL